MPAFPRWRRRRRALPRSIPRRSWYHTDGSTRRLATLTQQLPASDGTVVNIWVENAEASNIGSPIVNELLTSFASAGGIYDMLTQVGGPLWGAHSYNNLIAASGQPIDIVILNFDKNGKAGGTVGYFWGLHNLTAASDARSNESLSLYLDSETLQLAGAAGMKAMKMTMAHEGMHMQNFYRRGVRRRPEVCIRYLAGRNVRDDDGGLRQLQHRFQL
ncbi:M30 family zinc metallopeptidase [Cupriavidus basilensis]